MNSYSEIYPEGHGSRPFDAANNPSRIGLRDRHRTRGEGIELDLNITLHVPLGANSDAVIHRLARLLESVSDPDAEDD